MHNRIELIEKKLRDVLPMTSLSIEDQSAQHAGHEGAKSGGGHFRLVAVSPAFEGKTRIQRHRLVYDVLHDLMCGEIHALSIDARSPSEADVR